MTDTNTPKKLTPLLPLAFVAVSIAWGTTYVGIKAAIETIPPFTVATIRFIVAGTVMLAVLRGLGIAFPSREDWKKISIVSILLLSIGNSFVCWAELTLDSAFAALLTNVSPFMLVGLSALYGDPVPRKAWLGLVLGAIGVVILVSPQLMEMKDGIGGHDASYWLAVGGMFIACVTWSGGSFYALKNPPKCHQLMNAGGQCLVGGLVAGLFAMMKGEIGAGELHSFFTGAWMTRDILFSHSVLALGYLIVVGSWIGYVSYLYCVMHLPPHRTATTMYINILMAVLCGWLVLGEQLTLARVVGGAVIVSGVWIVNMAKRQAVKG